MPTEPSKRRMQLLELDNCHGPGYEGPTSLRRFKDCIHDYLPFGPTICAIIDTPQFQRLRHIKQLGTSYYVWPGASHNRFEHCLGVAYLAQTFATHLKESQPSLGITERDVQCVTIAGLCHDLGHGPWSHVWDNLFIPAILPEKKWCHEDASNMMFEALLEENGLDLDDDDARFIKALIIGDRTMCRPDEKPYLFQIVANKTNGLDVDKFDYIARDSHAVDQKNMSLTRLIFSARVIGDEICYDIKDAHQIFELCHTRMSLHKRIYTHKTARAIEYMLVDALTLAEPAMNIARRLEDPKKYLYLTDEIKREIQASEDPELAEAQAILRRIDVRDLYKSVDLKVFTWDMKAKVKAAFTPVSIVQSMKDLYEMRATLNPSAAQALEEVNPKDVDALAPKHIIIDLTERHHGMKNENPLDYIRFYSKHNPHLGVRAEMDDISVTLPLRFGELMLRVYTREPRFFGLVQAGYREVLRTFTENEIARAGDAFDIDEDVDMAEPAPAGMATPPADEPSAAAASAAGLARTHSRTVSRTLTRHVSDQLPMKENQFFTVPLAYDASKSPAKSTRRAEKQEVANAGVSSGSSPGGSQERAKRERDAVAGAEPDGEELDLSFIPGIGSGVGTSTDTAAADRGSPPPRKKSKA